MKKWLKRISIALIALLLFIVLLLAFLLFTSSGLSLSKTIANLVLKPQGIELHGKMSGQINQLKLDELTIKNDVVDIDIKGVSLTWSPLALLFEQKLDVKSLTSQSVMVDVNTHSQSDSNEDNTPFTMPLDLYASNIKIAQAQYKMNNANIVKASNINAQEITLIGDKLTLTKIDTIAPEYKTDVSLNNGYIYLNPPFKTNMNLKLNANLQPDLNIKGHKTTIKGDFAQQFDINTQGVITHYKKQHPFQLNSQFNGNEISTQFLVDQIAQVKTNFVFNNHIDWSASIDSHNNNWPINLKLGGVISTQQKITHITTKFCNLNAGSQALNCQINFISADNSLHLKQLRIYNNDNQDNLELSLQKENNQLKANWQAHIQDLAHYPVNLTGHINSQGHFSINDQKAQSLEAKFEARQFSYKELLLNQLLLTLDRNQLLLKLNSSLGNLTVNASIDQLSLKHLITSIKKIDYNNPELKQKWLLQKPSKLTLNKNTHVLTPLCLHNTSTDYICITSIFDKNEQNFFANGHITPGALLPNSPLANNNFVSTFKVAYRQKGNQPPFARLSLKGEGQIFNATSDWYQQLNQIDPIYQFVNVTKVNINSALQDNLLNAQAKIYFPNNRLYAELESKEFDFTNLNKASLNGALNIYADKLQWLSHLFPNFPTQINDGHLSGKFNFTDKLLNPRIHGSLKLINGDLNILETNTQIHNLSAKIEVSPPVKSTIQITGQVKSSPFKLKGYANWVNNQLDGIINIDGDKLLLMDTPEVETSVTPHLQFSSKSGVNSLTGNIYINRLLVHLDNMRSTNLQNTIQNDIVYVNNKNQVINQQKSSPFNMNLNVDFGNDANVSGLGIHTKITGKLNVISQPNQPILGAGVLKLVDGIFDAYGKKFTTEPQSTIAFNNGPVDNPLLAIRTLYTIPTSVILTQPDAPTQLGIEISGNAKSPRITLFSEPMLSQTDILSYILFGQSFSTANSNQTSSDALSQAAILFAINKGGDGIINELKDRLSLAEFSLGSMNNNPGNTINNTTTSQNNTAVFIGKQLTSRLYISYGVGVFTGEQQGVATFSLTPQWKLKGSVTSFDRGGDILYQTHSNN